MTGTTSANDNTSPNVTATCTGGTKILGGGGLAANNGSGTVALTGSYPSSDTVWTVTAERQSGSGNWTLVASVICGTAA